MEKMNLFGSVKHNDDNSDKWPDICENPTEQDMLDYIALVTVRYLNCQKAFKGGYLLNQLLQDTSRMTHDIDFSIASASQYETVKSLLKKLGDYFVNKGLVKYYEIKDSITETSSGGINFYREMKNGDRKFLGIDIGLHNLKYGVTEYELSFGNADGFEVERMLADKITAILSRKRFRRTKDLYDVYAITNLFDVDCDKLSKYIELRGNAEFNNIPFNDTILVQYEKAWEKLQLTSPTTATIEKPPFTQVLTRFYAIALPLKDGIVGGTWKHAEQKLSIN